MSRQLNELRPVFVVGIGMHPYQYLSETPYVELGLTAVREALADAKVEWPMVDSAYVAKAMLPMAPGRPMLRHLGSHGLPIVHVENASASGSSAFRLACIEVAAGMADLSLAVGVDKPTKVTRAETLTGIPYLANDAIVPFTHFALLADEYAHKHGIELDDMARVAMKNHRNAALNPYAQRRKERSLEEILNGKQISGSFTSLQCTPVGEGAAAVLVASEEGIRRLYIDGDRAIRVTASAARSQSLYENATSFDANLTEETTRLALQQAKLAPQDLDLVELHDAFTIEELEYVERMGLCGPGEAIPQLKEGVFDIGGRCAVNASGGLIGMGHPIGPTGIGQIAEITRQLRGEAGERQHSGARTGLAHMVGVGAVCYVHVLQV
ncbi:thiolase family protein [Proteobacteria bacterium 005FR1]|nr:thiolase family protein [Proteobacteria bacterium 005FR1]